MLTVKNSFSSTFPYDSLLPFLKHESCQYKTPNKSTQVKAVEGNLNASLPYFLNYNCNIGLSLSTMNINPHSFFFPRSLAKQLLIPTPQQSLPFLISRESRNPPCGPNYNYTPSPLLE